MSGGRQFVFEFPHRPALGESDYLVSESNSEAIGWIDKWPDWPAPALAVYGPIGAGAFLVFIITFFILILIIVVYQVQNFFRT